VTEQVEPLDPQVPLHGLDVVGIVLEVVARRIGRRIGRAGAARVEQDERVLGRELGQVGVVGGRASRPARVAEERRPRAALVPGERAAAGRGQARHA